MRIAIIAYDGISPFMLSTPLAIFGDGGGARVDVCAPHPRIATSAGLAMEGLADLAMAHEADIVILPGWRSMQEPVEPGIVAMLAACAARGAVVVGLCLGAFGLAQAGLLDGRRATTHWAGLEVFAARFPLVQVDPGAIFIDEGAVLTSAGIASGLDCCLHLLTRIAGADAAHTVARYLVLAPQRGGHHPQLVEKPALGSRAEGRVAAMLERLGADPAVPPPLDTLARQVGMSRRALTRQIRAHTGGNLGAWLRRSRLARAQHLLLEGARGFEPIARAAGFADAHALRAAFRSEYGLSPRDWLARMGS
jgi:transcriptional regulator GlxA family with amidase domain